MNLLESCPTIDELKCLSLGDLPGDRFEEISRHLENCTACQSHLANLEVPPDDFTQAISKLDRIDLERAAQDIDSESQRDSQTWLRHFLESAAERPRTPGSTLETPCRLGPYDVLRKIGQGGMGEVYEARHTRLDRPVALKVIRGYRRDDPAAHASFLQEMSTTGKFDHPNLVRAYDAWEADGCLYLVLELLEGDSLQKLADEGRLDSVEDVRQIMLDLCRALEHLHASGLVHRDIKPSNVMKLRNGNIKLIDYGLTIDKPAEPGRQPKIAGTVGYMAPEQATPGRPIDARCDIFSAGRLLQFLLRKLPGSKPGQRRPEPIRKLEAIAARMTQAEPADRFPDIDKVRIALESAQCQGKKPDGPRAFSGLAIWCLIFLLVVMVYVWYETSRDNGKFLSLPRESSKSTRPRQPIVQRPFPPEMVEIPAGTYWMGAVPGDQDAFPNESPRRAVTFAKPFRMSATEITVGQFRKFVRSTGYRTEAERSGQGGWKAKDLTSRGERRPEYVWSSPGYPVEENLPVTLVTWADANAFCEWLSRIEHKKFRLPTEAEWEYACRAGTTTPSHFPPVSRDFFCWSYHNVRTAVPSVVATREPNAWGLYDMYGNAREWCIDWYAEDSYDLPYDKFPDGPPKGEKRVARGGCFIDKEHFLRSSWRGYVLPAEAFNNQGFRVVRED